MIKYLYIRDILGSYDKISYISDILGSYDTIFYNRDIFGSHDTLFLSATSSIHTIRYNILDVKYHTAHFYALPIENKHSDL